MIFLIFNKISLTSPPLNVHFINIGTQLVIYIACFVSWNMQGDVSKKMLSKSIDILFLERFLNINNSLKFNNLYDAREIKIIK